MRLGNELELNLGGVRGLARNLPVVTYTALGQELLRTSIEAGCSPTLGLPVSASLKVLGDGPSAKVVRALGMHEKKPVAAFHTNAFRAKLPVGKALGPRAELRPSVAHEYFNPLQLHDGWARGAVSTQRREADRQPTLGALEECLQASGRSGLPRHHARR